MKTLSSILCFCLLISCISTVTLAQTKSEEQTKTDDTKKTPPNGDPVDLAVVTLKGSAVLTLMQNMIKQSPANTRKLTNRELDSINTLEKQPAILLDPIGYQTTIPLQTHLNGFIEGAFGMFTTPEVRIGYGGSVAGYSIYGTGEFLNSNGHINNAGYTTISGALKARYVAPEKYVLFGNSLTETNITYKNSSYSLFSHDSGFGRSTSNFAVNVSVIGRSANIPFSAFASVKILSINQNLPLNATDEITENGFEGGIKLGSLFSDINIGLSSNIDIRNVKGQAVNFIDIKGYTEFKDTAYVVSADVGFQASHSSNNTTRGAFIAQVKADYYMSLSITLFGKVFSGLQNNTLQRFLIHNPYISTTSIIDVDRSSYTILAGLQYHPISTLHACLTIELDKKAQGALFMQDSTSAFQVTYVPYTSIKANANTVYDINEKDRLNLDLTFTKATLENSFATPYISPLQFRSSFTKWFTQYLNSTIEVAYNGATNTLMDSSITVGGYFLLNIKAQYFLNNRFNFNLRFDNLTNSSIFVWKGFRERGAFASLGLTWQF